MGDTLEIFGNEYENVAGFKVKDSNGNVLTYTRGGGGGYVTQDANGRIILPSTGSGGGGISATQHTIHLEFSDETDEDINVYYDDALLGTMITAYNPATWVYNNKTVYIAQLDNVTWYDATPSPGTWETIYEQNDVNVSPNGDGTGYMYIPSLASIQITDGSEWRITLDGYAYTATAIYYSQIGNYGIPHYNASNVGDAITYNNGSAWIVYLLQQDSGLMDVKIERSTS